MEIPVINRISDFEAGINSLQNPTFVSQVFALSSFEKIYQMSSLWKWGALILALVASVTTIINRLKILIIRFQNHHLRSSSSLLGTEEDWDFDSDMEDTSCSSLSEDEEEEDEPVASSSSNWRFIDEDFSVRGSGHYIDDQGQSRNSRLRRRRNSSTGDLFSWPEFTNGTNVVKLWDNLGLGLELDLNNDSRNVISVYDMDREQSICSILGRKWEVPAVSSSFSSPAVIVSAATNVSENLLRIWDSRVGARLPAILAEWTPKLGKIGRINTGGVGKVYISDDVTGGLTVGDLRKVSSPLVNVTEPDVDTWWDADAVIVTDDESVDDSRGCDSVLQRG